MFLGHTDLIPGPIPIPGYIPIPGSVWDQFRFQFQFWFYPWSNSYSEASFDSISGSGTDSGTDSKFRSDSRVISISILVFRFYSAELVPIPELASILILGPGSLTSQFNPGTLDRFQLQV